MRSPCFVAGILRVQRPVLAGRFLVEEVGGQHDEHDNRHAAVSLLWIGSAIVFGLVALDVVDGRSLVADDLRRRSLVVDDRRRCLYVRRVCVVSQLALEGRGLCGS